MTKLVILGTGDVLVTKCYNTCFAVINENGTFLVDGGGGNGIYAQTEKAGIDLSEIYHMFVTHAHTDHLLGSLWAIRGAAESGKKGDRYVYAHDVVIELLQRYVEDLFNAKHRAYVRDNFHFVEVKHGEKKSFLGMELEFFDIQSKKAKQFGFTARLTDGKKLTCLGDEPYAEHCEEFAKDSDWLMHEAYCLYTDKEIFEPYEKCHSTAKDAGEVAQKLNAKNLIIYHTVDHELENRYKNYSAEAALSYTGNIYVPDDLDVIEL